METITVKKQDEAFIRITSDSGVEQELSEYFTFKVPGYKFMPSYRSGVWDGNIRLYNTRNKQLYAGLLPQVKVFAKSRKYDLDIDESLDVENELSIVELQEFIKTVNLPQSIIPRDYQIDAIVHAIRKKRAILLSSTGSGKSLIIYLILRYLHDKSNCKRSLIIVPTVSLVNQLASDFADYGYDVNNGCHRIYYGENKQSDKPFVIATWQSLFKMPKEYFEQFDVIIGDETHTFKANSLVSIMSKMSTTSYRIGTTGTLDGTQTHQMVLEGLFGSVYEVTTTKKLIEQKFLAEFNIKALVMKYSDQEKQLVKSYNYQDELEYIVTHPKRNKFIKNLVLSLDGNTLVLFQFVEKHGQVLYDMIKDQGKPVHFVHGKIGADVREEVRKLVETQNNAIIIASVGVFSTGINITSLKNIIFASPSKSRIRTLQSIGRVLRKTKTKTNSVLFDIADDFSWKKKMNYTLLHFIERLKIYNTEKFVYKIHNITLGK